jgi:hypothetical protein
MRMKTAHGRVQIAVTPSYGLSALRGANSTCCPYGRAIASAAKELREMDTKGSRKPLGYRIEIQAPVATGYDGYKGNV